MKFITQEQEVQLLRNGSVEERLKDHFPVVRLFTPDGVTSWLITRISPTLPDFAYGLCDSGLGRPEMASFALSDLTNIRGKTGHPVKRDDSFVAQFPISVYTKAARIKREITLDIIDLEQAVLDK